MASVRDVIKGSLRLIGAIASGETPSADEQADAFQIIKEMCDSWAIEGLCADKRVREEFTLVGGTASYTIGTSGTFNTARPARIPVANIEDQSQSPAREYPLKIFTHDEWANIKDKDRAGTMPAGLYYDETAPLGTVYLWPVPSAANKLVLYSEKSLSAAFATVTTDVDLPPGYLKALRYNLAVELSPEYGKAVTPDIATGAIESKEALKRKNSKPHFMSTGSPGVCARFDIITGE